MDNTHHAAAQPDHPESHSTKRRRTSTTTKERAHRPPRDDLHAALQAAEQRAEMAECRTRHLEARLAALVSTSGQWMWTRHANGHIEINLTSGRMSEGHPERTFQEHDWIDAIHPDDRERTLIAWAEAVTTKSAYENVQRMRTSDGCYRTLLVRAVPDLETDDNSVPEWIGTSTDITEQVAQLEREHAAYAEAETARAQVQAVLDVQGDGIAILDNHGNVLQMNAAASNMMLFNVNPREYTTLSASEQERQQALCDADGRPLPLDQWPGFRVARGEALQGDTAMELITRDRDGHTLYVTATGAPIRDADGHILGGVAVYRDETQRKQIEKTLREREAMFRNTFDQAAVGMAHTALDGYWLRVNERMCAITGYSREELLTRRFQDITHPDDVEANLSHARDLLAGKIQTYTMEKRYIRKDGSHIWVHLTVALARTPPGAQRYFITVVEDITARKVLEQQRSDILNIVAHDLSNPLTVMKARLQVIRRQMRGGKTPEASVIKNTASALTRMERLVGDLRDAASADTHQLVLKIAPHDIVALCRVEAEAQMQTNRGRHIDLILPAEPIIAEVDSDRITRLLGNLLSNAIKYSPPDQPITLSLERQIESPPNEPGCLVARIAVRDRGKGIAPDVLPRIFERFYRAPGIQEEQLTQPSLGLGLYICRMLAKEHCGFIHAESTLGEGSTFFVTLPVAHPKESRS